MGQGHSLQSIESQGLCSSQRVMARVRITEYAECREVLYQRHLTPFLASVMVSVRRVARPWQQQYSACVVRVGVVMQELVDLTSILYGRLILRSLMTTLFRYQYLIKKLNTFDTGLEFGAITS